jgi:hypothetical protein
MVAGELTGVREAGGGDTDWGILASGSFVGPVGSRPLQRRLAEAAAPGTRVRQPTASAWPAPDIAASGPVQRYAAAAAVPPSARPRYADGRLGVSRSATAAGVPSTSWPALSSARPPSGRAEVWPGRAEPALSPTIQTLLAADDAGPQPAVPSSSDQVVERAESSADGADRGSFDAFAPLTVSAVVEPPAAAGTAAAGGAVAAGGPGAAASLPLGDVDALVRRLYDPLARRLRAELRLDRERIGRSLDLRH